MIMQSALGVGSWRMTLDRLKAASPPRSPFEEDREAAYWGTLLGDGNTSQSDLNTALQWAEQEKLGWYLWVLRAHALRSAHLETAADEAQKTALQGGMRTRSLSLAVSLMQVCGVGILLLSAVHYIRRRRDPDALIPSVLQARPLPPLTTLQGDAMFAVFVVHLLARIFASLGALALAKAGMARHGETLAQILPIAAPAAAWIILSRRAGLRMETMGLKRLKSHADSRDSRMRNVVVAVMAYIALVPVLMLAVQVSTTLFGGMETPLNPTVVAYIEHTDFASRMRLLLHAVLQAPVIEEALFRGVFYRCLDVKLGSIAALIVSSAVFALLHPQLPLGFLGLFVLGGGFAVVYRLTGSVWPCVLTHALNNLVVTIQLAAGADV
jgi:membrane protease YdiL (CAAX protease family)